jgi:hypothetical protein
MKKIFDIFYYYFYCLILKKENEAGEERASFMFSTATSTLVIALYFLLSIVKGENLLNPRVFFFLGVLIYVVNGLLFSRYFVKSGRYQEIIEEYSNKTMGEKRLYAIIALTIFIGSFLLFALAGYNFSRLVFG